MQRGARCILAIALAVGAASCTAGGRPGDLTLDDLRTDYVLLEVQSFPVEDETRPEKLETFAHLVTFRFLSAVRSEDGRMRETPLRAVCLASGGEFASPFPAVLTAPRIEIAPGFCTLDGAFAVALDGGEGSARACLASRSIEAVVTPRSVGGKGGTDLWIILRERIGDRLVRELPGSEVLLRKGEMALLATRRLGE